MAKLHVTDFFIYRWRYYIGYGITIALLAGLLLFAGLFVPGGLTMAEMTSVATSAATHVPLVGHDSVINLPYYLLQHGSLFLFGVTTLSIKLPSLVLGLVAAIGMFLLLRQWFSRNVAVFASAITIASGQFLIVAASGTPSIVSIFFSVWILLAATMLTRTKRRRFLWELVFFVFAAFSLYTPLSLYALIAVAVIGIIHPHIRYTIKHLSKLSLIALPLLSLVIIAPLVLEVVKQPSLIFQLLGIPQTVPPLVSNAAQLASEYFNFTGSTNGTFMTPIFSLGAILLIAIGFVDMFRSNYTARSYTIMAWLVLLVPILLINPRFTTVLFVPLLLLLAMGLQALITYWYRLFPLNPYARIAGLIPLVVLVSGLMLSGIDRYTYGYYYDPALAANFSHDLQILQGTLPQQKRPLTLVVSPAEKPFYDVVARYGHGINVQETFPTAHETIIVTHDAHSAAQPVASDLLTSAASQNGNRFYIYKNTD